MNFWKGAAVFGLGGNHEARHELHEKFHAHMEKEGLSYGTHEEYNFRFALFKESEAEIQNWNNHQDSFRLAHNMFSTMTKDEAKKMLGTVPAQELPEPVFLDDQNLTSSMDWRSKGAVNPVKNQARCGSCWAFGATACVEAAHQIKTGTLLSLSEQQLVSCQTDCYGCQGGWQHKAFEYLERNPQALESEYPYTSGTGQTGYCNTALAGQGHVRVTGYTNVPSYSVPQLKAALNKGVVTVTIEADRSVFQLYHSGVLNTPACGTSLDHAVAAVGYGTEGGQDYYIVRNSWGASWGDAGYIKIAAVDGAGICGIQMQSLYPQTN